MSDLRDARLKKALDQAPDGDARPSEAVRETILHKARLTAAAASPRRPGWLWGFSRPWNSALATVGLLAFVSVLVWNQGLLEQHPEELSPAPAVPAAQPASVAIVPAPAMPEAMEVMPEPKLKSAPRQAPAMKKPELPAIEVPPPVVSPKLEQPIQIQPSQDSAASPPPLLQKPVAPPPPPAAAYVPAPVPAPVAAPVAAPAPAPAFAPPPTPAPVAGARAAQEQRLQGSVSVSGSAIVQAWTALRLPASDGPVLVPRDQLANGVAELLIKALRSPARDEAASGAPLQGLTAGAERVLQVEMLMGEQVVGRLEFEASELRWTPAGQPTRVLRPAELAALRKALEAAVAPK